MTNYERELLIGILNFQKWLALEMATSEEKFNTTEDTSDKLRIMGRTYALLDVCNNFQKCLPQELLLK